MSDRIDEIIDKLHQLQEIRQRLIHEPLAPSGAWIHQYEVQKQYKKDGDIYWYIYAKWQASEPIFKRNPKPRLKGLVKRGKNPEYTCHQHIGRVGSSTGLGTDPEVEKAYKELANRQKLDAINQTLDDIEKALNEVMPNKSTEA